MDTHRSTSDSGGLLSVSRRSIRRLAHAVKLKPGSPTTQSADAAPAKLPTRNTVECETFSKGRYSFRWKKSTSKKFELQGDVAKQEHSTESVGRTSGQKGASVQRKTSRKKSSLQCTNKTKGRPLVSWPFKRSQGKLDLQKLTSQDGRAVCERVVRSNSNRKKVGGKTYTAIKTDADDTSECGTPKGTVSAGSSQRVIWKDAGEEGDDAGQRRAKSRRRRRKSQSDAEDSHNHSKPLKQTRLVASLCTPRRTRRQEQPHRCKPKKLAVTNEEFLSLKKKLEWELAFSLYCRQKKEFMEINKHMYECDECEARVKQHRPDCLASRCSSAWLAVALSWVQMRESVMWPAPPRGSTGHKGIVSRVLNCKVRARVRGLARALSSRQYSRCVVAPRQVVRVQGVRVCPESALPGSGGRVSPSKGVPAKTSYFVINNLWIQRPVKYSSFNMLSFIWLTNLILTRPMNKNVTTFLLPQAPIFPEPRLLPPSLNAQLIWLSF
ncbi:hypothetical protein E2C01_029004 [Portunus trituberculatus]|uniref:Uncharacterized protein n=1 Tax=Portunus trituberculatus TaxID=210409 RepID=A0A5B7ER27_PORTR|nr:hypothetical protein [Portunus trituberculatus]